MRTHGVGPRTGGPAPASQDDGRLRSPVAQYIYTMVRARKAHGDKVILDNVTLSFLPGAKIGVVGPNGAGKTTLFKMLVGEEKPDDGEIKVCLLYTSDAADEL